MPLQVDISNASQSKNIPSNEDIHLWVSAAITEPNNDSGKTCELSIRIVDAKEISQLNSTYRHKSTETNVLSFPAELPASVDICLLGDIVICAPVVSAEAQQQNKTLPAHWAHMLIHAALHLQGYDHIEEQDANIMESREIELLDQLGFPNPYLH